MNRRSKRRLIVLASVAGVIVLAGVGGTALRKFNRERIAQSARAEGMAAYEAGDYATANRRLRVYLNYDRQDPEVLFALGDARRNVPEANARHLIEARTILDEVVSFDPDNVRAREILIDIHWQLGQWQELAQTATALLERDPDNLYAARLRVEANLQRGADTEALEAARQVVAIQDGAIDAHLEMVSTLSRLGRPERDLRAYVENEVAPQHEGSTGLQVIRAGVEFDFGQRNRAVALLVEAGQTTPTDGVSARLLLDAVEQVSAATRNMDLYELSRQEWLSAWLEEPSLAPHLYEVAAGRAWREGDAQRALDLAARAVDTDEVTEGAFAWGVLAAIELGRKGDAQRLKNAFEASIDEYAKARAENWQAAIETFERWRDGQPAAQDPASNAVEIFGSARGFEGIMLFVDAMRLAERNDYGAAVMRLRPLGEQPSWRRARLTEARMHMSNNQPGRAIAVIRSDRVLADSGAGVSLLADAVATVAERSGNPDLIDLDRIEDALSESPENPLLLATAGRIELVSGNTERATEIARRLARSEAAEAALASVRFAERLGGIDPQLASDVVDRVAQTAERPQDIAVAAAGMARQGRDAQARALIDERAAGATGGDAQAWTFARVQLANAIDDDQSLADLAQLSEANASDARVQREILSGATVWGDPNLTSQIIVRLRDAQGQASTDWRVFEARRLLADEANPEAARNAAALFAPIFQSESGRRSTGVMLLAAQAFDRAGDQASRLQALRYAADGDDPLAALPRLIALLQDTGRSEAAAQRLRQYVELGDLPTAALRVRQQLLERQGLTDLAQRDIAALAAAGEPVFVLRNGIATRPTGSRVPLNNAERAALEADLTPEGQVYASQLLARIGRVEEGLARLRRLPEQSDAGTRTIIIARYMNEHGRLDEAIAMLVEQAEQDGDADLWMEAARLLVGAQRVEQASQLLDRAGQAMPDNEAIANFAASLESDSGLGGFDRMARFTLSAGQRSDASEGLEQLAEVCSRYVDGQITAAQAAQQLESVASSQATLYPVWPLLISAYEQLGDDAKAVQAARNAVSALPADYRTARDAVQVFLRLGQFQEASGLAGTWLSLAPDDLTRAQAEIALGFSEHNRGNAQRAASLLEPHADLLLSDVQTNQQAIRALAEALVLTDQMQRAGSFLESLTQDSTDWAAFVASIAAAAPPTPANIDRAHRWLEMVTPQLTADARGAAYLASAWMALHTLAGDRDYATRAAGVARAAAASGADSWELQATLATANDALGQYQAAVDAYERALQMSGQKIPALLNNAAWLYTARLGEHERAVTMAQEAVNEAEAIGMPSRVRAIFMHTLGVAQLANGGAQEALDTFDAGLALAESASLRLGRVEALVALDRKAQASEDLRRLRPADDWTESNRERYTVLQNVLGAG